MRGEPTVDMTSYPSAQLPSLLGSVIVFVTICCISPHEISIIMSCPSPSSGTGMLPLARSPTMVLRSDSGFWLSCLYLLCARVEACVTGAASTASAYFRFLVGPSNIRSGNKPHLTVTKSSYPIQWQFCELCKTTSPSSSTLKDE